MVTFLWILYFAVTLTSCVYHRWILDNRVNLSIATVIGFLVYLPLLILDTRTAVITGLAYGIAGGQATLAFRYTQG